VNWPGVCKADDKTLAEAKFREGVSLFSKEDYPGALAAFQDSYRIATKPAVLYNIAMCQKALYRYVDSLASFRRYLETSDEKVNQKRRAEVIGELDEIDKVVGKIRFVGLREKAIVLVDGRQAATFPVDKPILVDPGKRAITVTKDGFIPYNQEVVVTSGDELTLEVRLLALPGKISVDCGVQSAVVSMDGQEVGACPYQTEIAAGSHEVAVRAPGMKLFRRQVEVEAGNTAVLSIILAPEEPAPEPAAPPLPNSSHQGNPKQTPYRDGGRGLTIYAVASIVAGIGACAVGGYFTYKGIHDEDEGNRLVRQLKSATESNYTRLRSDYDNIKKSKLPIDNGLMISGYSAALLFLAAGVVMLVIEAGSGPGDASEAKVAAPYNLRYIF
jgi:hypothetical protein